MLGARKRVQAGRSVDPRAARRRQPSLAHRLSPASRARPRRLDASPWHFEDPPSRAYSGRSSMAPNPRTLAPNTSLHRTPAAAPPSPVSS